MSSYDTSFDILPNALTYMPLLYPLLELSVLTGVEESKALLAWPAWRR
jgi:hypothetical protein